MEGEEGGGKKNDQEQEKCNGEGENGEEGRKGKMSSTRIEAKRRGNQ